MGRGDDNFDYTPSTPPQSPDTTPSWPTPSRPPGWLSGAATLPRLNSRSSGIRSDPFRRRPALFSFNTGSSIRSNIRSPDRFLPTRRSAGSATQNFHANKDPKKLSPSEKLIRQNTASEDAFNPRRRVTTPVELSASRPIQGTFSGANATDPSAVDARREVSQGSERQLSYGTVWTVGGLAPVSAGVSNGRGGLLGSGTNAPLYTSSFSSTRANLEQDMEKHENRLALALDLDRAQRVFEFTEHQSEVQYNNAGNRGLGHGDTKTAWKDSEWVISGPRLSIVSWPYLSYLMRLRPARNQESS